MSHQFTSLENESELEAIVKINNLCEKRASNFERQKECIDRNIGLFEKCSSHVKRMATITNEKQWDVKETVERQTRKTQKVIEGSVVMVDAAFERIETIHTTFLLEGGIPTLPANSPFDELIQNEQNLEKKLRKDLEEASKADGELRKSLEDLKKQEETTLKAIGKSEKQVNGLKEELKREEIGLADLRKTTAANQKRLAEAMEEDALEEKKRAEAEESVKKTKEILEKSKDNVAEEEKELYKKEEELKSLDDVMATLESSVDFDPQLISMLPDFPEINEVLNAWGAFSSSRKEQTATLAPLPANSVISDSETIDALKNSLENMKKQKKSLLGNIEQMRVYKNKYLVASETLKRKQSGMEAVKKQIEENREILNNLKVTENAARPPLTKRLTSDVRLVEQDYQTPKNAVQAVKRAVQTVKRTSMESGSTRPMSTTGPLYPGIQLFSQEESKKAKKVPVEKENEEEDEEEEEDISDLKDDSSLVIDDSGSTQDESIINGFFSPLKNNGVPLGKEPVVEFSMTDHLADFSKRQAQKRQESAKKSLDDEGESPEDVENFDDSDAFSEEDSDEDDDLMMKDDQNILDVSVWDD